MCLDLPARYDKCVKPVHIERNRRDVVESIHLLIPHIRDIQNVILSSQSHYQSLAVDHTTSKQVLAFLGESPSMDDDGALRGWNLVTSGLEYTYLIVSSLASIHVLVWQVSVQEEMITVHLTDIGVKNPSECIHRLRNQACHDWDFQSSKPSWEAMYFSITNSTAIPCPWFFPIREI